MPTTQTTKAAKSGKINKSAWIRSQPASLSAKDVFEKAKGEGIKLSIAQVYTARSNGKKAKASKGETGPKAKANGSRASNVASGGADDLQAFKRLVLNIGLAKAESYLAQLKASVGL